MGSTTSIVGVSVLAVLAVLLMMTSCNASDPPAPKGTIQAHVYDDTGELVGPVTVKRVVRDDAAWKADLTPEQFRILRKHGTERAFTGELLKNKADGVYRCAGCGLPLFDASTKFNSGTGWPSYFKAIGPGNVAETEDRSLGVPRTEITCARCDGHLGHVFDDGPAPTGLRYCVNSEALSFTPKSELKTIADPAVSTAASGSKTMARAVFAGGCFWCVEAVFEELEGVKEVVSGYSGDSAATADYKLVCTGRTKHAEAVEIHYDPSVIAYEDLLQVHFATHDPTQLNRQGNDVGPQYRSAIFVADAKERALAEAFIADLNESKAFPRPVVTTIEPLTAFYEAEPYHQNYVCDNPNQGYVRSVAMPKVEKVRKAFKDRLKKDK